MALVPDATIRPVNNGMANDNNRDSDLFKTARKRRVPRPSVWRVVLAQAGGGLLLLAVSGLWFREAWVAVLAGTALSVLAQSYFTWRSLHHYGARFTGLFVVGTAQGLFGKWIIVVFGLVALWAVFPGLNAIAMLLTVCVLNTLAAALTPILVKDRP